MKDDDLIQQYAKADEIQKKIINGKIPIDFNGHFKSLQLEYNSKKDYINGLNHKYIIDKISNAFWMYSLKSGQPSPEQSLLCDPLLDCEYCGERLKFSFNEEKVQVVTPCSHPNGLSAFEFELNIPSGKFVVENDLRYLFPVSGTYYINITYNIIKTIEQYAKAGLAHGFVGNTCPGVYKCNLGSFVIGYRGTKKKFIDAQWPKGAKYVAGVTTDLWWYSIADYDEYVRRAKEEPAKESVVKCKPGVYKFIYQYHLMDREDYNSPQIYTYMVWDREPEPVKDYQKQYDSLNFTAGQIMAEMMKKSYYKNEADCANQLMCVIGTGLEYHPNGWIGNTPDLTSDSPTIEIPNFEEKYRWYPLSNYSNLMKVIGYDNAEEIHLNESFVKLAFNVLRCMIKYGIAHDEATDPKGSQAKKNEKQARKIFDLLIKKYPNQIPDNCKELTA